MGVISENDRLRIKNWAAALQRPVSLRYALSGHPADAQLTAFVTELSEIAGCVRLKKDADTPVDRPTLFPVAHVGFQAIPQNHLLDQVLAMLADNTAFSSKIPPDVRDRLDFLRIPALIRLHITPTCPFCPAAVAALLGLSGLTDNVHLTLIDGTLFPEVAEQDRVQSVPTIILDGAFRWTGSVDLLELVTLMLDRNPADLSAETLRAMVEDGDAEGVARLMTGSNQIFPAFLTLLTHSRWSVRLGAMVAFETLVETAPTLAKEILPPIAEIFPGAAPSIKGDLLHVLGESGNPEVLLFLKQALTTETDPEVCEAAREAMEKLR